MDVTRSRSWNTGWTAASPLEIGFADVPADQGVWAPGRDSAFEYRDLELAAASDGLLGAQHLRVADGQSGTLESGWQCHDLDFQFMYVVKGWLRMRDQHGDETVLRVGDAAYLPPLYWYEQAECSADLELFEITGPAAYPTFYGRDSELPERAAELPADRAPVYTRDTDDSYVNGAGPRRFFGYRDLGTSVPTEGRIHLQTVRVAGGTPADMETGWHYHSMAQWVFILDGRADIRVESNPRRAFTAGGSMCLGAGPGMRHNLDAMSPDYKLVEMCIPLEYDTIAVDAPADAVS